MKVFILTEGGREIGFGHITRCSAIYDAFTAKGVTPYFIVNADKSVKGLLGLRKLRMFDWVREQDKLLSLIKGADIVIVDSYLADRDLYVNISRNAKVPVYIDDNNRLRYPRGIVINGSIYAKDLKYPGTKGVTYLLGTNYMPLRKAFWDIPNKIVKKKINYVMITFGGSDSRNMTPKILKLVVDNYPGLTKLVIAGKGFKNIKDIKKVKDNNTHIIYRPDANAMKNAMLTSDMAISAGGQTLYEFARIGVPVIAVAIVENQLNNIKGWRKSGFVEDSGWWADNNLNANLLKSINRLVSEENIRTRARTGKKFVDGKAGSRIINFLLKEKDKSDSIQ